MSEAAGMRRLSETDAIQFVRPHSVWAK